MVTTCGVWLLEKAAPWKITTFHLVIGPTDGLAVRLPAARCSLFSQSHLSRERR